MIQGNISKINCRTGNNSSVTVTMSILTYSNIDNPGETVDVAKHSVLTGDCLELDYAYSHDAFRFKVYEKQKGGYVIKNSCKLFVDFTKNPMGDLVLCQEVTEEEFDILRKQHGISKSKFATMDVARRIIAPYKLRSKAEYQNFVKANPQFMLPLHPEVCYS